MFQLQIYISASLANLYEGVKKKDWRLVYTGIPVLMYDKGSAKSRSSPRVTFVLAERGTCFALWKDTIDNLSNYKVSSKAFHTMCLSTGELQFLKSSKNSSGHHHSSQITAKKLGSVLTRQMQRRNFGKTSRLLSAIPKILLCLFPDENAKQSRQSTSLSRQSRKYLSPVNFLMLRTFLLTIQSVIIVCKCL